MIAAIYARKSTDQSAVADEQKSVTRQVERGGQVEAAWERLGTTQKGSVDRSRASSTSEKERRRVMTDIPQVIDIPLWDRASWKGVIVATAEDTPPLLALAFKHGDVGKQIFAGLRKLTGEVDARELIRVAIIEGDVPGEAPGYTINISTNPDAVPSAEPYFTVTRFHRMNPEPESQNLALFKESYAKWRRYRLLGATLSSSGRIDFDFDQAIGKSLLVVRHVSEIVRPNDIDSVILGWHTDAQRH